MNELLGRFSSGLPGVRLDAMTVVIGLVAIVILIIAIQAIRAAMSVVFRGGVDNDD